MRKVNIMVEVSDDIYDNVVEPFKKSKKFAKLIQSLLEGYLKDDYIAMFVEGTLDAALAESRSSFESVMQSMKDSLAVMSMMESEASQMMESGIETVKVEKDIAKYPEEKESPVKSLPDMFKETRKEEEAPEKNKDDIDVKVKELEGKNKELSKEISDVKALLEKLLTQGISTNNVSDENHKTVGGVTRVSEKEVSKEEVEDTSEDFSLPPSSLRKIVNHPVVEEKEEISLFDDEEDEYDDFLEGLLEGNMYTG